MPEEISDEGLIEFLLTLGLTPPRRDQVQNFLPWVVYDIRILFYIK